MLINLIGSRYCRVKPYGLRCPTEPGVTMAVMAAPDSAASAVNASSVAAAVSASFASLVVGSGAGDRLQPWSSSHESAGARALEEKAQRDPAARAVRERIATTVVDDWKKKQARMQKAEQHRQATAVHRAGVDRAAEVAGRHAKNLAEEAKARQARLTDREERHAASVSRLGVAHALADARRDEKRSLREEKITMTLARRAAAEATAEQRTLRLGSWLAQSPQQRAKAQHCSRTELQLHTYVKRREAEARQDAAYARRVEMVHLERERVQNKLVARESRRREEAERARRAEEAEAAARAARLWHLSLERRLSRDYESFGRRHGSGGAAAAQLVANAQTPACHMLTRGAAVSVQPAEQVTVASVRAAIASAGAERRERAEVREEARLELLDVSRQRHAARAISLRRQHALDKRKLRTIEAQLAAVNAASFAAADAAAAMVFQLNQKLERTQEQLEQVKTARDDV